MKRLNNLSIGCKTIRMILSPLWRSIACTNSVRTRGTNAHQDTERRVNWQNTSLASESIFESRNFSGSLRMAVTQSIE